MSDPIFKNYILCYTLITIQNYLSLSLSVVIVYFKLRGVRSNLIIQVKLKLYRSIKFYFH